MIYIKIHKSTRNVAAVCDANLLGKKFEEGKKQLDVRENFYNGEEVSEKKAIEIIRKQAKEGATFNIVGQKSIAIAKKAGIITKENIGNVGKIKFALVL